MLVSQNVVVFFNKDVIIMKPLMIAVFMMEIVEVALQKLLGVGGGGWGGGGSMTAFDFPGYLQQIPGNLKS